MKKLKLFFACLLMAVLSIGQVWAAEVTYSLTPDATSTGSSATSYQASLSFTYEGVSWTMAQFNPSTRQTKTNQSSATAEFNFHNTSAFPGRITKVVVTYSALTVATGKASEFKFLGGTSEVTATTGGDAATWNSTNKTMTWTPAANTNYTYFAYYMNGKTATGSNYLAESDAIVVTYETSGGGKTLTSIAVSGAPTKTAYYVGDEFDPAGLVVTGTYSDDSQAAITSGITWAYDPSQELALNQTSIGVTATVNEISSPKYNVTGLTVTAPVVSNWQVTAPADLETGDVVVLTMNVGGTYYAASNGNGTSSAPSATSVAVTGSNLSATPATTLQWTVTVVSEGVFQFAIGDKKLYCTDTNNGVRVGTDPSTTFCNTFDIHTATDNDNKLYLHATTLTRYLGVYNNADWRCYGSVNNNIKNGSLVIFKENDNREAAGLEFATKQYLIKKNTSFSAPELTNQHGLTVTYTSSNEAVAEVAANGAITIKADATGAATITASFDGDETYKDGSASYTIFVAEKAGTNEEGEILTEAIAKELIDLGCTLDVYVTGTILTPQYYDQSKTYTVTLTEGFQFYYFYAGPKETTFDENILNAGDVLVAYGNLKKSGNSYRLNPCYMVSREPYAEQKVDISNTEETAYTPAKAIELYNDVTSDLTKVVYVKGVVVASPAIKYNSGLTDAAEVYNGTYNVYVKAEDDNSENPTKFEFFRMYADDNNTTFEDGDIQVGEVIIAKGILSKYNSTYEFAQGCQMYSKKSKVTMTFDDLEMEVEDVETLAPKTITLATAETVSYDIKEGSDECVTLEGTQLTATAAGTATIVATVATTEEYIGTSVEFTVTVSAAAPVLTDYYEKVTETAGITDGTYLIVYEGDNTHTPVAFNGALETLEAVGNNIPVTITNDKKIAVTEATEASTFFIDVTAGSIQSASGKYIGANSYGNRLDQSEEASTYVNALSIDGDGNAVISISNTSWEGDLTLRYNYGTNNGERFRYYKNGQQAIQLYKLANETVKANPELAWSGDVEITLGETFTAPTLDNPHSVEGITYASDNEALATVTNAGVIELDADATGTAHITASFAGNDDYKAASVSCTIIVNASAPTPLPTAEAKVIVVGYNSKFYAMSTTVKNSNGFEPIEVTKEDDKIIVKSDEDAAAIQWQIALGAEAATFQNGESKYLACSDESNTGLALLDDASEWAWDATASCYKQPGKDNKGRTFYYNYNNGSPIFRAYTVAGIGAENYSGAPEFISADKIEVQVPTPKINPELAFDPAEVELTLGETFTAPTLGHVDGFNGTITYSSSKPAVATVDENTGEVTIVANGTTTITASFEGNDDYEEDEATYTITVNKPAPTPTSTIYRKVTATADITDGEYLIVYEGDATHDAAVFDGSLDNDNIDVAKKVLAVEIENDEIAGNTELDAATFTIDVTAKTLQSASGYYIGRETYDNGMDKSTETAYTNTFAISEGNAVITGAGNCTLRYNYASDQLRFRYYKSGQQAIQLYKKETPEPPTPTYTEVRGGLTAGNYYTICYPKAMTDIQGATLWSFVGKDANFAYLVQETATTIEAGKPYILYATAETVTAVLGTDDASAGVNGAIHGTLSAMNQTALNAAAATAENDLYLVIGNELRRATGEGTGDNTLPAQRAFVVLGDIPNAPANMPAHVRAMPMQKDQAQGFENLDASEKPLKVMIDGTLYILRGEKVYDATGRLVK